MSLTDSSNKIIYAGDDVTTVFAITFPMPYGSTGSDVYLYVVDDVGTVTKLSANYSVNVNALTVTYPLVGGVAPLGVGVNALPNGWQLVVIREEPLSQTLQLVNQGVLDLPSLERAFDKLTMLCQQLQEQLSRCFTVPINVPYNPTSPTSAPIVSTLTQATGTLAQLIAISNASPLAAKFGIATDIGGGQLVYYPGYASTNGLQGSGWYPIGGGV